jgi:uncharacterized protein YeaO (DUF488 family)
MSVRIVRLGSPRASGEGLRRGTGRRPPRGVKKAELGSRDFYDIWYPDLAPSAELLAWAQAEAATDRGWARFARKYQAEMQQPHARRTIALLAALSHQTDFAVGCYCADESRCHRSLLRELLLRAGADVRAG